MNTLAKFVLPRGRMAANQHDPLVIRATHAFRCDSDHRFRSNRSPFGAKRRGGGIMSVVIGSGQCPVSFSHRFSFQVELVGAVHEAVEDRVSQGRVTDDGMPLFDRELAGDEG